ncbi:Peptidase family S41 [compost metagenome]
MLTAGSKKIGYLAYARFGALSTPPTLTTAAGDVELDAAFTQFANAGVTDLIIDFRYNGGGYVYAAEHLTNLIAPSSVRGTMFTEYYNSTMQSGNAKILSNQPLLDKI